MIPLRVLKFKLWMRTNGVHISIATILFAFTAIVIMLAFQQAQQQEQLDRDTQIIFRIKDITLQLDKDSEDRTRQIDAIDRHLDCIVVFFSRPAAERTTINDVDICQLGKAEAAAPTDRIPVKASEEPLLDVKSSSQTGTTTQLKPNNLMSQNIDHPSRYGSGVWPGNFVNSKLKVLK